MRKTLNYIFDPLCGWCYGAGATLSALADVADLELRLLPSGLFSGDGARPMDDAFAAYAWGNDQRIERLTGQRFTERYRTEVLSDHRQAFDSGPATLALTAVALTEPHRELEALQAIQHARYVDGRDITRLDALAGILKDQELLPAASLLAQSNSQLLDANRGRVARAQVILSQFGARGVPTFILEKDDQRRMLPSSAVYSDPRAFVEQLISG